MALLDGGAGERKGLRGFRLFLWGLAVIFGAALPALWSYRSANAVVLGRFSPLYTGILALHGVALGVTLLLGLMGSSALRAVDGWLRGKARAFLGGRLSLGLTLFLLWVMSLAFLVSLMTTELGKSASLLLSVLGAVSWISFGLILVAREDPRARARALVKCLIVLLWAALGLAGTEALLRALPGILPASLVAELREGGQLPHSMYVFEKPILTGYRLVPRTPMSFRQMASEANLYVQNPGLLRPVEQDFVLNQAEFVTDELGYRNGPVLLETYPVAVSGDSYTSFIVEPRPWPTILSEQLGLPVMNVGMLGYGPQQEVEALIRYGLPRKPRWVILAYYEGNDLRDAHTYELKKRSGLGWAEYDLANQGILERSLLCRAARHAAGGILGRAGGKPPPPRQGTYPFPLELDLDGRKVEISFSPGNLASHAVSKEMLEALPILTPVVESFRRLGAESEAAGARVLVVYIPTKEHCYIPLLSPDLLQSLLRWATRFERNPAGMLVAGKGAVTSGEVIASAGAQRDVLRERLSAEGIEMLDLTPVFQEAARIGQTLFWTNDTHWTPAGNALAASTIARRLREGP